MVIKWLLRLLGGFIVVILIVGLILACDHWVTLNRLSSLSTAEGEKIAERFLKRVIGNVANEQGKSSVSNLSCTLAYSGDDLEKAYDCSFMTPCLTKYERVVHFNIKNGLFDVMPFGFYITGDPIGSNLVRLCGEMLKKEVRECQESMTNKGG